MKGGKDTVAKDKLTSQNSAENDRRLSRIIHKTSEVRRTAKAE